MTNRPSGACARIRTSPTRRRGAAERLRCLHEVDGHGARRHEIQGLVGHGDCTYWTHSGSATRQRGFTLIELLVVISLISILAAMGLVQYRNSVQRTQEATLQDGSLPDARRDRSVLRRQGQVPDVARLAGERRLPAQDSRRSDHQVRRHLEDGAGRSRSDNPTAEPGVYDVKSGAQGTALDGTAFSEFYIFRFPCRVRCPRSVRQGLTRPP